MMLNVKHLICLSRKNNQPLSLRDFKVVAHLIGLSLCRCQLMSCSVAMKTTKLSGINTEIFYEQKSFCYFFSINVS